MIADNLVRVFDPESGAAVGAERAEVGHLAAGVEERVPGGGGGRLPHDFTEVIDAMGLAAAASQRADIGHVPAVTKEGVVGVAASAKVQVTRQFVHVTVRVTVLSAAIAGTGSAATIPHAAATIRLRPASVFSSSHSLPPPPRWRHSHPATRNPGQTP